MKNFITSLPHKPKQVALLSIIIALCVGVWGYKKINTVPSVVIPDNTNNNTNLNSLTLGFLAGGRIKTVSVKTGDTVKQGDVLATLDTENVLGALTQARAVYNTAQANYEKIINGATGTSIDVAKAAVHTAETNLEGVTKQQSTLVSNAYQTLLNSSITAFSTSATDTQTVPTITGTYTLGLEGDLHILIHQGGTNGYFSTSGIIDGGLGNVSTTTPQPIGNSGLYIQFPTNATYQGDWTVSIPNKKASNYLINYNAYLSAVQTKNQAVANAQAVLDQANTSLVALVTNARPEDIKVAQAQVENAKGAVQVAQGAYNNTVITAPHNGKIISVSITPGQIAIPNSPAIEFTSDTSTN